MPISSRPKPIALTAAPYSSTVLISLPRIIPSLALFIALELASNNDVAASVV